MGAVKDFKQFDSDMAASQELVEQYNQITRRIIEEKSADSDADIAIKAAAELGYTITVADLERARAQSESMDVDEMEAVAGGVEVCWKDYTCVVAYETVTKDDDGHDFMCVASWHCLTAFMHTTPSDGYEGDDKRNNQNCNCWSNYCCLIVNRDPCSVGATSG